MAKSSKRKQTDKFLTSLGLIITVTFLITGGLAFWAYSFATASVQNELAAQKIYFPEKGSKGLEDPQVKPYLEQYAGQQLLTGPQAKAYANHYIAVHLDKVANGQTYAQVSAKAQKNPNNAKLKAQADTLFKGETLRGLLLGDAYAFSVVGNIAGIVSIVFFAGAGLMAILVMMGAWRTLN